MYSKNMISLEIIGVFVGLYIIFLLLFIVVILFYRNRVGFKVEEIKKSQIPEGVPPF